VSEFFVNKTLGVISNCEGIQKVLQLLCKKLRRLVPTLVEVL